MPFAFILYISSAHVSPSLSVLLVRWFAAQNLGTLPKSLSIKFVSFRASSCFMMLEVFREQNFTLLNQAPNQQSASSCPRRERGRSGLLPSNHFELLCALHSIS
jgi:hypothetical protein